ncbi:HNH endonuclease signature motif containing protein [Avibacterium endocarditidis]|uniref:HNH endonuclease signature motif containing protein n=1 Tax=Avibacterium endocarditidis TaxID=380674 RepID=UPI0039FDD9EA
MTAKKTRHRDYEKEYRTYHGTPEQIKKRVMRNKARRMMANELGTSAIAGKEVDHKKPLSRGGSNARSNLQLMTKKANRKKGSK